MTKSNFKTQAQTLSHLGKCFTLPCMHHTQCTEHIVYSILQVGCGLDSMKKKNGSVVWISISFCPVYCPSGAQGEGKTGKFIVYK